MILGILSDTHGERQRTAAAIQLLQRVGAEAFIHCGDVGGTEILDELAGLRAWIVCGNTDFPDGDFLRCATRLGLTFADSAPLRVELDGRILIVFHGHEEPFKRLLAQIRAERTLPAELGRCDYVLYGHSHMAAQTRCEGTRLINPGALHRAVRYTVATLDLKSDQVQFWDVRDGAADATPTLFRPRRRY